MDKGVYYLCQKIDNAVSGTDCSYYATFTKKVGSCGSFGACEKENMICYKGKIFDGNCYLTSLKENR